MSEMISIPRERLEEMVGQPIHLSWANAGCVWILERVEGEVLYLYTPKTRRHCQAKAKDACYVRRWEQRLFPNGQ